MTSASLRGFGPAGILALLVILAGNFLLAPLSALLALAWARRSGTPLSELGFVSPASWTRVVLAGTAAGVALKLIMKAVVMPLLGAPPLNPAYRHLVGNEGALPGMVFAAVVVAGFGEETLYRGFLFERGRALLGSARLARTTVVMVTSILFALAHYPEQGLPGVEQALVVGLVWGAAFAATGRLWPIIIAHAAFDLTAVAIIYLDLESVVAHVLFG